MTAPAAHADHYEQESEAEFFRTLPDGYLGLFPKSERQQHYQWAAGRSSGQSRAWLCARPEPTLALILVVAEDRPGLLADLTGAFQSAGLSLDGALIHTRNRRGGPAEAFDFFWVRAPADQVDQRVGELLSSIAVPERLGAVSSNPSAALAAPLAAVAQPTEPPSAEFALLVVAVDQVGLARKLARWAAAHDLDVVGARLQTTAEGQVVDRLTLRDRRRRVRSDTELQALAQTLGAGLPRRN